MLDTIVEEQKKEDKNKDLKIKFLEYYAVLPIQKLAADSIARDEDTITNWKKEDPWFSDQIAIRKSEWAKRVSGRVRSPEWLLERITRTEFAPPQQKTDITSGGKPIPILNGVTNVPTNDSDKETT